MKQGTLSFFGLRYVLDAPAFAYCTAFLLCGLLAGLFTGMHIPQQDDSYRQELLMLLAGDAQILSLRQALQCGGSVAVWYVLALMAGSGRGRELYLPLVLALRGFLMAFSVAASIVGGGIKGCLLSLLTTGVSAMLSVPALLVVSAAALMAGRQAGKGYGQALGRYKAVLLCTAAMTAAAVLWRLLIPDFLSF